MSCLLLSDRNRLTDLENKLMVARVEEWREGIESWGLTCTHGIFKML